MQTLSVPHTKRQYDKMVKHLPEPQSDLIEVLKSLMAEHHLKQKDVKEIGSQGVVSEVLNGKRTLNSCQIQALAKRFNVSTAVFM